MAFKDVSYTVGQKLSSTALNNNYSNFTEILNTEETVGHTGQGSKSIIPYFDGRPVKTVYFYGIGQNLQIFGQGISSVTYPSAVALFNTLYAKSECKAIKPEASKALAILSCQLISSNM